MARSAHHAPFHPTPRAPGTPYAVALGGGLGTLARYGLDRAVPTQVGHFPTATLLVNLSGSVLIGLLLPFALAQAARRPLLRPFLITGILGGWTTFSALATDAAQLLKSGHVALAVGDLGATVVGGLLLVAVGFYLSPAHTYVRYPRRLRR
ncbi:MAG: fluoride efflux transporter FluC [Acidimicrobiales bacterium]